MKVDYKKLHEAKREGYIPFAGPYKSVSEAWMVENALQDIKKNKRDYPCLVKIAQTIEIYILPNYYGRTKYPYLSHQELVSKELSSFRTEKYEEVINGEERTKEIAVKPIKQEPEEEDTETGI